MCILETISRCQDLIYQGFTSADLAGMEWLKMVCTEFEKFCRLFRPNIASDTISSAEESSLRVECLLCVSQIVKCIRFMELTLRTEATHGMVLPVTRQHFLDRILWCLGKLSNSIKASSERKPKSVVIDDSNFVDTMDHILDLVSPLTMFSDPAQKPPNVAANRAENLIESANIRSAVNVLIGHALSFANVVEPDDRKPLTTVCQTVLNECIEFEKVTSLDHSIVADDSQRQIRATSLENALYQLDGLVNDSLLRMVFAVFGKLRTKPLDVLAEMVECQDDGLDEHIVQFDVMADRLQQIGIFAAAFAPSQRAQITIRSGLASAESLESILIPSILSNNNIVHSDILSRHWTDEMDTLRITIQHIIDTHAFCSSLCEHLSQAIVALQRRYVRADALAILPYCNVFMDHLRCNWSDLQLDDTSTQRRLVFDNFELMLIECGASVDGCTDAESHRVIKRFRILHGVLKKFRGTLKQIDASRHTKDEHDFTFGNVSMPESRLYRDIEIMQPSDSLKALTDTTGPSETEAFFRSFGISRSIGKSILYSSAETQRAHSSSQKDIQPPRIQKKASLRSKLFKRMIPVAPISSNSVEVYAETDLTQSQSLDLQITNILEELTDLSTTLYNGT